MFMTFHKGLLVSTLILVIGCAFKESPAPKGGSPVEASSLPQLATAGQINIRYEELDGERRYKRLLKRGLYKDGQRLLTLRPVVMGRLPTEINLDLKGDIPSTLNVKRVQARKLDSQQDRSITARVLDNILRVEFSSEDRKELEEGPFDLEILLRASAGGVINVALSFDYLPQTLQTEFYPRDTYQSPPDFVFEGTPLSFLGELTIQNPKDFSIEVSVRREILSQVVVRTKVASATENTCGHVIHSTQSEDILSSQVLFVRDQIPLDDLAAIIIGPRKDERLQIYGVGTRLKEALTFGVAREDFKKQTVVQRCTQVRCGSRYLMSVPQGGFDPSAWEFWRPQGLLGEANTCHGLDRVLVGCFGAQDDWTCPVNDWGPAIRCALWDDGTSVLPYDYGKFCRALHPTQGGAGSAWRFFKEFTEIQAGTEIRGPILKPIGPEPEIRFRDGIEESIQDPATESFEKPSNTISGWRREFEIQ